MFKTGFVFLLCGCFLMAGCAQEQDKKVMPTYGDHVLNCDSEYYLTGPQQSTPPNGTFKTGVRVQLIKKAGSYSLVESADGIKAYVSTGALDPVN